MAYVLEEDHSDAGYNMAGGIYGTWWLCQTFPASGSYGLKKIDIPLCSEGTPPPLYLELWSTSGGEPDSVLKSQLITGELSAHPSHDWVETVLDAMYTTTEDDVYAIVVRSSGAGDSDNRGRWWYDSSGSWAGAEGWSNDSGSTWHMTGSVDHLFKIYSELGVPSDPINPTPEHKASDTTLDETAITWEDGGGGETYDVYFRTFGQFFEKIASDITDLFVPTGISAYSYGQLYFWCVIAKNESGSNYAPPDGFGLGYGGTIWYFNAILFEPPLSSGITLSYAGADDGVPTGTPTGENNMITIKKLVAVANDLIWIEDV